MVGQEVLKVLEERKFNVSELIPVASKKSAGSRVKYLGKDYKVVVIDEALKRKPDLDVSTGTPKMA